MPWHASVAFSASWLVKSIPCNRPNEPEVIVIGVLRLLWRRSFRLLHKVYSAGAALGRCATKNGDSSLINSLFIKDVGGVKRI